MYEKEIKIELCKRLKEKFPNNIVYAEKEFYQLGKGNTSRIDTFMINNGLFIGYEIKSNKDAINRLKKQIPKYIKLFNKLIIVSESKKIIALKKLVPSYCGLIEVFKTHTGEFCFNRIQKAKKIFKQNKKHLLNVIRKKELLLYFSKEKLKNYSKRKIINEIVKKFSLKELRSIIETLLKERVQKEFINANLNTNRINNCITFEK